MAEWLSDRVVELLTEWQAEWQRGWLNGRGAD